MNVIFQSLISENALRFITPFLLVIIGIVVETRYVNRVAMFTNAAALYIFYHPINMSYGLGVFVNFAILIGIVGGVTRILKISLFAAFYQIAWIISSVVTGILLLYGLSL
jgi:hypothetical protein